MLPTFKSSETEPWKERVVVIHRPARSKSQILPDGNPQKVPRMGTLSRIGHPLFFLPRSSMRATSLATFGDRDRRASTVTTGEETIHLFRSPFWEGHGGVLAGRSGSGMERTNAAVDSHLREFSEQ